jgi:hypothetical protein
MRLQLGERPKLVRLREVSWPQVHILKNALKCRLLLIFDLFFGSWHALKVTPSNGPVLSGAAQ